MKYTLELGEDGQRYWLCHHQDGTKEPLPSGFALQLYADVRELEGGEVVALPIGTKVEMEMPADPDEAEREAILRILTSVFQRASAKNGVVMSAEDARAAVLRNVQEMIESSAHPAIERARGQIGRQAPPLIVPARNLSAAEQLLKSQLGVPSKRSDGKVTR